MKNKEKYRIFCKNERDISIFSQDWWLDAVCGKDNWEVILVEKGGQIVASMPIYSIKRYIFTYICQPELTQTMGIFFKYPKNQGYYKKLSFEKEIIESIVKQLPNFDTFSQSFNFKQTNLLPFHWAGFDINVGYTYVIEDISIDDLENTVATDIRRRRRRKAIQQGVQIFDGDDIKIFYKLNKMTFERQGMDIPYSYEFIKNLYHSCKAHNAVKIFFAKYEDKIIAANFLIFDENTVYYLMGGIDSEYKSLGAMDLLQFEGIKFALCSGKKFDFEGSMIESIEKYFRSFGAQQKPYYNISKESSKLLKIVKAVRETIK